jgi:hypothetical protein
VVAGSVSCWEPGEYATQIEAVTDAVDVRVGRNARCALTSDKTLVCFHGSVPDSLTTVEAFALADNSGVIALPSGELIAFDNASTEQLSVGLDSARLPILFTDETQGRCLNHEDITTLATDDYARTRQNEIVEGTDATTALSALCDNCFKDFTQCVQQNPSDSAQCYAERTECIGLPIDFIFPTALVESRFCGQDQCMDGVPVGSPCSSDPDCRSMNCAPMPFVNQQESNARICQPPK